MAKGSVLDLLKDAHREKNHRDPTTADLLGTAEFMTFDDELAHGYRAAFTDLRDAYDRLARPSKDPPALEPLTAAMKALWRFLLDQHNGLSIFELLRWWRMDRQTTSKRKNERMPSSLVEDVTYLLIAVRLLVYAVGNYDLNQQARGFTQAEWTFILPPLRDQRGVYLSTYEKLLRESFNIEEFLNKTELFLRLAAIGQRSNATLASNEQIRDVVIGLLSSAPSELGTRRFQSGDPGALRQTQFAIGDTVANKVYVVYFDLKRNPNQIYVNFAHAGEVLYWLPRSEFARYAELAEYRLVAEATAGMLELIQLLFQIAAAVPGVVASGLAGVVDACLMPIEQKAAEKVMEALGLDPSTAGWWVLGINILARGLPRAAEGELSEDSGGLARGTENRGTRDPMVDNEWSQSRAADPAPTETRVGPAGRGTTEPSVTAPETTAEVTGQEAAASTETSSGRSGRGLAESRQPRATKRPPARRPRKGSGPAEAEEHRASPVSSKRKPPGKPGVQQEGEDPATAKGGESSSERPADPETARGIGPEVRAVPAAETPEVPPPRVRSALAAAEREVSEERIKVMRLKDSMTADAWRRLRAGATKRLYNLLERRAVCARISLFPRREFLEQVEIVGVRIGSEFQPTQYVPGVAKGRIVDFIELDGSECNFHELKSPSTLTGSVKGGLSRIDYDAIFDHEKTLGEQLTTQRAVIDYAKRTGGKVWIQGTDPLTGAVEHKLIDPRTIRENLTDYVGQPNN